MRHTLKLLFLSLVWDIEWFVRSLHHSVEKLVLPDNASQLIEKPTYSKIGQKYVHVPVNKIIYLFYKV